VSTSLRVASLPCAGDELAQLFRVALASAEPEPALRAHWPAVDSPQILALGKAAVPMARAAIERYGPHARGLCISPLGERLCAPGWQHIVAGHPVPNAASLLAGKAALRFVTGLHRGDQCLALISGGGSALMELPTGPFETVLPVYAALLDSGLPIDVMNAVRVRLSAVKGGRLLAATRATVTTLAISDVPGDTLHWIASGPTVPWRRSDSDRMARQWLARHWPMVPIDEPPPIDVPTQAAVVASPSLALADAAERARAMGYRVIELGADLGGDAIALGRAHAQYALQASTSGTPTLLLSGGETSVSPGAVRGLGGRNQTYLLALLVALDGARGIAALAADTDGIDGTGPAAGAWFDECTPAKAQTLNLDPHAALAAYDAGGFFAALGQSLLTGATGTNVNDFRAIAVGER
jgi:hydroxypyruvate reductase